MTHEEVLADAQELAGLLNRLHAKYGDRLELIADDPYCTWDTAGFLARPGTGHPVLVTDAFEVLVSKRWYEWKVIDNGQEDSPGSSPRG